MALAGGLFFRQFWALFVKNWIVLSKHPFVSATAQMCTWLPLISRQLNLLRCFIVPVAYGIFLAVAQTFLVKPNNVSDFKSYSAKILTSQGTVRDW